VDRRTAPIVVVPVKSTDAVERRSAAAANVGQGEGYLHFVEEGEYFLAEQADTPCASRNA
jgi:hypothetical protein